MSKANNITFFTVYIEDSNKNETENPLSKFDENTIIFVEQENYNYVYKLREKYQNKTYLLFISKDDIINDKHLYINMMISVNPFNTNNYAWCDIDKIDTYLSQGISDTIIDIESINSIDIKGLFLFK